jgi:signal peptidase I
MGRTEPWRPIVAILLSLATPGLGHVYCGKPLRGLFFLVGLSAILVGIGFTGLSTSSALVACLAMAGFAIQLAALVDAGVLADRVKEAPRYWYNRWYIYATVVAVFLIVALSWFRFDPYRLIGFRTFRIPIDSMSPALIGGDCFLARWGSFTQVGPKRGEIVVFPYPEDRTKEFVKRVIGLPGERIHIKDKQVFVNDQPIADPWGVHNDPVVIPGSQMPRDNFGPVTVPVDSVFVLGDNRDHSLDSRFWGYVAIRDIEGKAICIYWSADWSRINTRLDR